MLDALGGFAVEWNSQFMEPLWISLLTALVSALIASLIGSLAARVRFSAKPGLRWALDILFLLPLTVPDIIIWFSQVQGIQIMPTEMLWTLSVLYFCSIMGFRKVTPEMMDAARLQGLGQFAIFWRVFFPLTWLWLLGGFAIGLLRYYVVLERAVACD